MGWYMHAAHTDAAAAHLMTLSSAKHRKHQGNEPAADVNGCGVPVSLMGSPLHTSDHPLACRPSPATV